jgi:hypothetical protein
MLPARAMPRLHPRRLAAAAGASLLASLAAQEPAAADPLVVATSDPRVARALLRGQETPKLAAGEHWVLALGADGTWSAKAAGGRASLLRVRARPAALAQVFAAEVEQARQLAAAAAADAAREAELERSSAASVVDAIFGFPTQVDDFALVVEQTAERAYEAHAELTPVEQGWLARALAAVKPSGAGVPRLAGDAFTCMVDLDPAAMGTVFQPVIDFTVGMVPEPERAAARKLTAEAWKLADGTMAFAMERGTIRMAMGCTDAAAMERHLFSSEWADLQRTMLRQQAGAAVETTRKRLGDLEVLAAQGTLPRAHPFLPEGRMQAYTCVAGGLMLGVVNGPEEAIENLAKRARQDGLARGPLEGDDVLRVLLQAEHLAALHPDAAAPRTGLPQRLEVRARRKAPATLVVDVHVQM